jgi:hypothetical protein
MFDLGGTAQWRTRSTWIQTCPKSIPGRGIKIFMFSNMSCAESLECRSHLLANRGRKLRFSSAGFRERMTRKYKIVDFCKKIYFNLNYMLNKLNKYKQI